MLIFKKSVIYYSYLERKDKSLLLLNEVLRMRDTIEKVQEKLPDLRQKFMDFYTSSNEVKSLYVEDVADYILHDPVIFNIVLMKNKIWNMHNWYDITFLDSENAVVTFDYLVNGKKQQVMKHFHLTADDILELLGSWRVENHYFSGERQAARDANLYLIVEDGMVSRVYDYKNETLIGLEDVLTLDEAHRKFSKKSSSNSKVKKLGGVNK